MFGRTRVQGRNPREMKEGCRTSRHIAVWTRMQRLERGVCWRRKKGRWKKHLSPLSSAFLPPPPPPVLSPLMNDSSRWGMKKLKRKKKKWYKSRVRFYQMQEFTFALRWREVYHHWTAINVHCSPLLPLAFKQHLLCVHVGPSQPSLQTQVNDSPVTTHVPPFSHGLGRQLEFLATDNKGEQGKTIRNYQWNPKPQRGKSSVLLQPFIKICFFFFFFSSGNVHSTDFVVNCQCNHWF